MNDKNASWIKNLTNLESVLQTEPFAGLPKNFTFVDRKENMPLIKARRSYQYGSETVAYAARVKKHLMEQIEECEGSKNALFNAALEIGLYELKKQGKTLIVE